MILVIAGPYLGFPHGRAPTSRVEAYARGLADAGRDVRIILLGPSETEPTTALNVSTAGTHHGLVFEYTSRSTVRSTSRLSRALSVPMSVLGARRRVRQLALGDDIQAVLLYTSSLAVAWGLKSVVRAHGAAFAVDLCEIPFYDDPDDVVRARRQDRYGRRFLSTFDVVFAISRGLLGYAQSHLNQGARAVLVPVMVDCHAFDGRCPESAGRQCITYAGTLDESKDGVAILMKSFSKVATAFPSAQLRIVGDYPEYLGASRIPELTRYATALGIADRVEFTGQVPRSTIPDHLGRATVLALARPRNEQTEAGLPTKLGEYLASGRPVVVTTTSDIEMYLKDGQSAYLAPPDDVDAFASALCRALSDPEQANRIGAAGRSVAERHFDYRACGAIVSEALTDCQLNARYS